MIPARNRSPIWRVTQRVLCLQRVKHPRTWVEARVLNWGVVALRRDQLDQLDRFRVLLRDQLGRDLVDTMFDEPDWRDLVAAAPRLYLLCTDSTTWVETGEPDPGTVWGKQTPPFRAPWFKTLMAAEQVAAQQARYPG